MAWKPINETYLVRPEEIKTSRLVPEQFKKSVVDTMMGTVVSAGKYRGHDGNFHPLACRVGDRIKFGAKVGADIDIDGEKLLLVADANVIAVEYPSGGEELI